MVNDIPDMAEFHLFIDQERDLYDDINIDNRVASGFGQLGRYLEFLGTVKRRHDLARDEFLSNTNILYPKIDRTSSDQQPEFTPEMRAAQRESYKLSMTFQLEQESYLHFAYPMLSTASQTIEWFFGPERNCSLSSHRGWTKCMESYCAAKSLKVPESFFETAERCLTEINDPRDHDVVHSWNPRAMHGLSYGSDGHVTRSTGHMYPKNSDNHVQLPDIEQVHDLLARYVAGFTQLVQDNRTKSVFASSLVVQTADHDDD